MLGNNHILAQFFYSISYSPNDILMILIIIVNKYFCDANGDQSDDFHKLNII